jgi:hypothetical protein
VPRIFTTKTVLLLVGAVFMNPAAAADAPVQFTNTPSVVSIVPQSGFFLGLGASANSVDFDSQYVYGRGTSNTPASYNLVGVFQPPIIGTAAGGTGLALDNKTALAPSIQGGYFGHFYDTPWIGGVKFSYSYLGINSAYNNLLIPQAGGFEQGGAFTPFTGNYLVQSYRQTINNQFSMIPIVGQSFERSYLYLGAGPTLAQTTTAIDRITGFANVVGIPTSITGVGQGSTYSFGQWLWGIGGTIGATYFIAPSWFVDISYTCSKTQNKTSNWGGTWSDTPISGNTRTGTNMGYSSGGVVTQALSLTLNRAF